jgi:FkbM family methyltransferase
MNNQQGLSHFINELNINKLWEVYCFEPNPLLSLENKYNDLNITIYNEAVWTENGTVVFGQYGDDGTSQGSLIEETGGSEDYHDFYNQVKVKTIDIHEFISKLDPESNIYVKMDIE